MCDQKPKTGGTSGVGTAYPSGASRFTPGFQRSSFTLSLVLCVCFVNRCLSFCTFSVGHCAVCPLRNLITLWYLQTLLKAVQLLKYTAVIQILLIMIKHLDHSLESQALGSRIFFLKIKISYLQCMFNFSAPWQVLLLFQAILTFSKTFLYTI